MRYILAGVGTIIIRLRIRSLFGDKECYIEMGDNSEE